MAYGTVKTDLIENSNGLTGNAIGPGFRNRIINGAMVIDQRNAGASVVLDGNGVYPVDRWRCDEASDGAATGEQVQDVPAGFVDSLKITTTTADGSLSASQYMGVNQFIEGYNTADFGWGTANAKTVTLSFWVKSSLTGTFAGGVDNNDGSRSYVFNYTISSANTWEYKTVTIAGDTSGTWNTGNARGLGLRFGLGAGTTYEGTVGSWQSGSKFSSSGATSVIGTLNATWYITGVQLEVGSTATSFDYRPYGTELALCQRYFTVIASAVNDSLGLANLYSTSSINFTYFMQVSMRTAPTIVNTIATYRANWQNSGANSTTAPTIAYASSKTVLFDIGGFTGLTAGNAGTIRAYDPGILGLSAEL